MLLRLFYPIVNFYFILFLLVAKRKIGGDHFSKNLLNGYFLLSLKISLLKGFGPEKRFWAENQLLGR